VFGKKGIVLDKSLMERVKRAAEQGGYPSVAEYVAHVLERELARGDDSPPDADVKKQLEGLGYLS
jgi:hypothetical protein